jgi:hypothetical protein
MQDLIHLIGWVGSAILALVPLVAYFQWQTAHHRVVLDLFDRRFRTYEEIRHAIANVVPGEQNVELLATYSTAMDRAQFLFGPEVSHYLKKKYEDVVRTMLEPKGHDEIEWGQIVRGQSDRLQSFYEEANKLFRPYMMLPHKIRHLWLPF